MAEFSRTANMLVGALKQDASKVMVRIAKNFVQDCVKFTPPFSETTSQESFAAQKKVGEGATGSDINAAFKPAREFEFGSARASIQKFVERDSTFFNLPQNEGLRRRTLGYIATGDWDKLRTVFKDTHQRMDQWVENADKKLHSQVRGSGGRVKRSAKTHPYWVFNEKSIAQLLRDKLANVGIAKSGWKKAAVALGLKLPRWITRHNGAGEYSAVLGTNWPKVTVGNLVPYIQAAGAELRIIQRAIANRVRNMQREYEYVIGARLKRAGGRLR